MPAKSLEQYRFMQAIAHGWKPTRKKGPSKKVAREFVKHGKPRRSLLSGRH